MLVVGSALGAYLARQLKQPPYVARVLSMSAASGALSGFFGIPFLGSFFVLELPHSRGPQYFEALSPTICASVAASLVAKSIARSPFEGHYTYDGEAATSAPGSLLAIPLVMGFLGSVVSTIFVLLLNRCKSAALHLKLKLSKGDRWQWLGPFLLRIAGGIVVGFLGCAYPQSMFLGETSMATAVSGQQAPLFAIGNDGPLLSWAVVPTHPGLSTWGSCQVGCAKMLAILLGVAAGFPGGVIFPLFFAGGFFGTSATSFGSVFQKFPALTQQCGMASLQATTTRTPLSTVVILAVTVASYASVSSFTSRSDAQRIDVLLPCLVISIYIGLLAQFPLGAFGRFILEQQDREDLVPKGVDLPPPKGAEGPDLPLLANCR